MSDDCILVDYETYAACKQTECFLDPVSLPNRTIHIAKQYERQMMLLSEISMRVLAVGAYPNDLCAKILERFVRVSEAASLSRTTLGEIFRIEVNDHVPLSKKILQPNITSIAAGKAESRCDVTNSEQLSRPTIVQRIGEEEVFVEDTP